MRSKANRPRGCVCGFVSDDRIRRRSAPILNECFSSLIHERLLVTWIVLPMQTQFVNPGDPVLWKPETWKLRESRRSSGNAARFPFGIPSSLFLLTPKSSRRRLRRVVPVVAHPQLLKPSCRGRGDVADHAVVAHRFSALFAPRMKMLTGERARRSLARTTRVASENRRPPVSAV